MKASKGFTLIEVMIVVVIVAILAAVAIPSYQSHIQKTRRADAKSTLAQIASVQERYFFTNNAYATSPADFQTVFSGSTSPDGHYSISIDSDACTDNSCYELTATAQGAQANDTACQTFTINQVGVRKATKTGGADNTAECW